MSDVGMMDKMEIIEHLGNSLVINLGCGKSKISKSKQLIRLSQKVNYEEMSSWFQNINWDREMDEMGNGKSSVQLFKWQ
jgi:hypothetical protein